MSEDEQKNIDDDYNYTRANLYNILEKGRESLDLMIEVARQSEHPRAFEVLSNMMKQMAEINEKLTDLNKKQKSMKEEKEDMGNRKVTNNNLFIGSSVELQRLLKQNSDEEVITIEQTGN
jgi:hypothetical protein|tara:strand:- start:3737 stop:4096 length:360 start_codon:yes stop_codon:yes gene_type:complete